MRAIVVIRAPDGALVELGHGDLIGRLARAELCLDDPRISEVHAMVSLRGATLKLLALRGRMFLGGAAHNEVALSVGQTIELAPGLGLRVADVFLPDDILGIEGDGLARQPVHGVMSLFVRPRPRLDAGFASEADLIVWGEDGRWRAQPKGEAARQLNAGDVLEVAGMKVAAVSIPLAEASSQATVGGALPVHIVANFDTAKVQQGQAMALVAGVPARLLCELVALAGPASWDVLASEIWGNDVDREQLRTRFDMGLSRLRKRLKQAGIRPDLVMTSGTGLVELVLRSGDVVEDRM